MPKKALKKTRQFIYRIVLSIVILTMIVASGMTWLTYSILNR